MVTTIGLYNFIIQRVVTFGYFIYLQSVLCFI